MTDNNIPIAIEKVFRINELLEAILVYLSEHDILYNAQRVNLAWKRCIQRSRPLQQICWLCPISIKKDTDPLFLPLNSLFEIGWVGKKPMLGLQQELGGCNGTPRAIAKAFADGKIELHTYYLGCLVRPVRQATREQIEENERDRLYVVDNHPVEGWQVRLHDQLDRNHLHPILNNFNHISHFWTGYGNHVILALDEEFMICYRLVARFMETIVFLLQSEPPGASWRRAYITRPACTKVTVTGRKMGTPPSLSQGCECNTGVTVEQLFRVVVDFSKCHFAIASDFTMRRNGLKRHIADRKRVGRALEDYAALELLRLKDMAIGTNNST